MQVKKIATGSIITLSTRVVTLILNLITVALYTHVLGPELKGKFAFLLIVSLILDSLTPPIKLANIYFSSNRQDIISKLATNSFVATGFSAAMVAGILSLASMFPRYHEFLEFRNINSILIWYAALLVPLMLLWRSLGGLLLGRNKIIAFNTIQLSVVATLLIIVIILFFSQSITIYSLLLANLLAHFITVILAIIYVRRLTPFSATIDWGLLKDTYFYSFRAMLWNATMLTERRFDVLVAGILLGNLELGLYSAAVDVLDKFRAISESIATMLFPTIAGMQHEDDGKLTAMLIRNVVWTVSFFVLVLAVFATPVITLLFGESFILSSNILRILLPGAVMLSIMRLISADYAGRGQPEMGALFAIIDIIIMSLLVLFLAPIWNGYGIAIASVVGYTVASITAIVLFTKKHNLKLGEVLSINRQDIYIYHKFFTEIVKSIRK